jgi:hypothetical protein
MLNELKELTFNEANLYDIDGLDLYNYDAVLYPTRQMRNFKLARQNRSALTTAEYADKIITVRFYAESCTRPESEAMLAELRRRTQKVQGVLVVPHQYDEGIEGIQYYATVNGMTHEYVGGSLDIEVTFYCADPVGMTVEEFEPEEFSGSSPAMTVTDGDASWDITLLGSAVEQLPVITATVTSVTEAANKTISIGNGENNEIVTIVAAYADGDILEIDCAEKTVKINGAEVNYSGKIPTFVSGENSIVYEDDLTAPNVTVNVTYHKRYA